MQRSADYFLGCWAVILALNVWIGWNRVTGEIHTERAIDAQRRSDYNSLVREARQARNMFNEYNDVCLPLQWHEGIGLYYLDQIEPSIAAFETAYRLNPWAFPVLNNYASALLQHGDTPQAIGLLEKAVEINPKYDEGKLNLSYAYLKLENYTKALEWARRVDTIPNPTNEDARRKNRETLTRQANFMKELEQKMHSDKK
jgi:tetratricopeptide (TPR) repeat protein